MSLQLDHIQKSYGTRNVILPLNLHLLPGHIHALLGPSGSGKTTLLKLIAGLESPDGGEIYWDDVPMTHMPVHKREFGMVFQEYALFPHLSVIENVAYGLKEKGWSSQRSKGDAMQWLQRVDLTFAANYPVHLLSGGEQQRVALVRALAPKPRLLLLDEPFAHLDPSLKRQLQSIFYELLSETDQTVLWVTHDQQEAMQTTKYVHILLSGCLMHSGETHALYQQLESLSIARFLGLNNIVQYRGQWVWVSAEAFVWDEKTDKRMYRLIETSYLPNGLEVTVADLDQQYVFLLSGEVLRQFLNQAWQRNDLLPLSIQWERAKKLQA